MKEKNEKNFKKYQSFYFTMKNLKEEKKKKINKNENKILEKKERLNEIEKENEKKRKMLMKKISKKEKNKELASKQKFDYITSVSNIRRHFFEVCSENRRRLYLDLAARRRQILSGENWRLSRAREKEEAERYRKLCLQSYSLQRAFEFERSQANFERSMQELVGRNVMKLTPAEKVEIFARRLREEKKKKEEEEERRKAEK